MDVDNRRSESTRPRLAALDGAEAYRRLWNPGSTLQFGMTLPISEYFPEARDYKIYWKGAAFRSNVAVVRGGANP